MEPGLTPTQFRLRLRQSGYDPLPLNGKAPHLDGWQRMFSLSSEQIEDWAKHWDDHQNTGILTRFTPTLDIDILNPDAAKAAEDIIREEHEEHGDIVVRIGQAPKRAIFFRTDKPFPKITRVLIVPGAPPGAKPEKIEFLADGQQIAVAGIHPDTRRPYSCHKAPLSEIAHEQLPYIDAERGQALVDKIAQRLIDEFGYADPVPVRPARDSEGAQGGARAEWPGLITNIIEGNPLHDSTRDLAASAAAKGFGEEQGTHFIKSLLLASKAARDERFWDRFDEVPGLMRSGLEKFAPAQAPDAKLALPFINIMSWADVPPPPREWAVPEIIPLRQPTLLSGHGAIGKSIILLQLIAAHLLGREWLGLAVEQGPGIYLGAEDEDKELWRRLYDILAYYGAGFRDVARDLHLLSLAGEDALLGVPDRSGQIVATPLFNRLLQAAGDIKPKLIGLDGLADVFGGNEINRAQVRQFIGLLRKLAIVGNSGVILLGHPSLTGMNSDTGLSGSTHWHNAMRARMYLKSPTSAEDEQADSGLRELTFKKNNYGAITRSITLRYRNGVFVPEVKTSFDNLAREQKVDDAFLAILDKLADQKRPVSPRVKANNYAPSAMAEHPDGKPWNKKDYAAAMERLLNRKAIHVARYGPPSRSWESLAIGPPPED